MTFGPHCRPRRAADKARRVCRPLRIHVHEFHDEHGCAADAPAWQIEFARRELWDAFCAKASLTAVVDDELDGGSVESLQLSEHDLFI